MEPFSPCIPVVALIMSSLILKGMASRWQVVGVITTLVGIIMAVFAAGGSTSPGGLLDSSSMQLSPTPCSALMLKGPSQFSSHLTSILCLPKWLPDIWTLLHSAKAF